ncbi:hypothetical protein F441_00657 [Phytophthora nicotianae CJ01A1]|uniref:Uncharacterized protein n=5 Tax=Phytophthora nicotianae TaxID=4792 RepID=W2RHG6_PHYN3|nr:hypothetical protein PPTG_00555 [Phytophthora nicotianae INRA-310]ETI56942.1 hypothetical protein F443_00677 [Phytophthora nicotianae P1569]ETK96734.1 hypothetical protein L915_00616 [Phytophthora nicotianae]ETO85708.1 hypothetical protein F444_00658 [Phytophthora nicotianae P1976]ETP26737.1 hypothetical protein F441_00657 [Phytophthora nicotianae CJ01A1]ETL50085.1 hypothetical protein L916_00620 [Phytophthora nicotianae]
MARQVASKLHAGQRQLRLLSKALNRINTSSDEMLDLANRDVKPLKTNERELFIAQLELKEMGQVAQVLQNGDEMKKQVALTGEPADREVKRCQVESEGHHRGLHHEALELLRRKD